MADMVADKVANMETDMLADKVVNMVADMAADIKIGQHGVGYGGRHE